ncbi:MAG: hypothetical protein NTV51_27080 [Verrucomicrobia bacterium]|nr:hypothetical protein [Verrucomicrobiota bacterium]
MKLPGFIVLASLTLTGAMTARAADATAPVDYTQRNTPYAPAASVSPEKKAPEPDAKVQEKRVDKTVVDKKPAAVGDRRAAIDTKEAREKNVREKDSHTPEKVDQPTSAYNQRESSLTPGANVTRLPMIAKYQDSLTASNVTTTSRTTATDRATAAKINRFVYRKNAPDTSVALEGASVTPAAGGAAVKK